MKRLQFCLAVFAVLALTFSALAQVQFGQFTGTVTDPTGAAVANAKITVSNPAISAGGAVTADVATVCGANNASFTLSVTDSSSISRTATLNVTVNGSPSNTGATTSVDRPNVMGKWQLANPTVAEWFNTAAFVANAPYTYGDAGRNIIRGP